MKVSQNILHIDGQNKNWCVQVDNRHDSEPVVSPEQAAQLCDRNFVIGGDGVMFAPVFLL